MRKPLRCSQWRNTTGLSPKQRPATVCSTIRATGRVVPPFDLTKIDTGATAWVLASTALVLLMTPGLAFFYGGMVRAKSALGMLMQNFVTIALVSITWVVV